MTLAEAAEIFAYWEENPPGHLMLRTLAAMLGWRPAPGRRPEPDPKQLAATPPPGLVIARGADTGMPVPLLDRDAMRERNRHRLRTRAGNVR